MNYTEQAKNAMAAAKKAARDFRHPYVGTEHLLLGLYRTRIGVAAQVMAENGVEEQKILKVIDELVSVKEHDIIGKSPAISPRLEFILELSKAEAVRLHSEKIGTDHMLLVIIREADCVAARILQTLGINLQKMTQDILYITGVDPKEYLEEYSGGRGKGEVLEQYGTDLTMQASEGKLDPVIGREEEINRLIQILSRRTKNNPCLVGEPCVGTTAVIEALAMIIADGTVPDNM